jgi:hypothetical protein
MTKTPLSSLTTNMRLGLVGTLALLGVTSGCGTTIGLTSDRFTPQFDPAPLANYRGKAIVIHNFANADNDTSFFLYPGNGRRYGGPVLTSYFWYCFKSAFTKLGVNVLEEGQSPAGTPALDVTLVHIAEAAFKVNVTVAGVTGQPPLQKTYEVAGPPITDAQPPTLESRAYQMVSALFLAMVSDPLFQALVAPQSSSPSPS